MDSVDLVIESSAVIVLLSLFMNIIRGVKYEYAASLQFASNSSQCLRQPRNSHRVIDRLSDDASIVVLIWNTRQILHKSLNSIRFSAKRTLIRVSCFWRGCTYKGFKLWTLAEATCNICALWSASVIFLNPLESSEADTSPVPHARSKIFASRFSTFCETNCTKSGANWNRLKMALILLLKVFKD